MKMATTQKRITLEELREKTAKDAKEAAMFSKAPTLKMTTGMEIFFRVKKVVAGKFKDQSGKLTDFVIANEVRLVKADKIVSIDLDGYLQDGLQGPRTSATVKAGGEARIPNFLVKRFAEQKVALHEDLVYYAKYTEDVEGPSGTFKRANVGLAGTDFPES